MPFQDLRGNWSQRNQRRDVMFTDQHGRKYAATVEVKSGHPCGLVQPQFTAPLMPERNYLELVEGRPYDIVINYGRWKADLRTARSEWERDGRQRARRLEGAAYDATKPFSADVLEIIGNAPQPIEPILAAEQGNKYVLGLSTKVDPRLEKFFEPADGAVHEEDFSDEPSFPDLLEEEFDPEAVGNGKRHAVATPVGKGKQPKKTKETSLADIT